MIRIRFTTNKKKSDIQDLLDKYPVDIVVLEFFDTRSLNANVIQHLMTLNGANRLQIRIIGGYDDKKIADYPHYRDRYLNDNTYTLSEMLKIYHEIEEIEKGINPNWDELQKLIYFIGYLKNKIIYHPFFENVPSKEIRSLTGLFSRKTVCAGYALILKELCDRNGIYCMYVEGASSQEYVDKGWATHSWNIVRIHGQLIPVDLTWNATDNNRGKMLDNSDLFNVNEFAKTHIPLKGEPVQDYRRNLKSINGVKVNVIDSFINKDMRFENNSFMGKRNDGGRFEITLIGQFIEDNNVIYRYYYQGQTKDGKKGRALILYSTYNISEVLFLFDQIDKIKEKIREAYNRNDIVEAKKLEEKIRADKIKYLYDSNQLCDDLLLSVENIRQAVIRGDYFVGGIKVEPNGHDVSEVKGVFVDTDLGKKIGLKQKTCKRSDGSTFIIEDYGLLKINNSLEVYRYRVYESVVQNGKKVIIKNTVYTDQDLFTDNRQNLYDDFLGRSRLDRKTREANGYLGYYSKEGVRTYSSPLRKYFMEMCKRLALVDQDITDYYKEITIFEMGRLVKTYEKVTVNGEEQYRNRTSGRIVTDEDLKLRIDFSYIWLFAAGDYDPRDAVGFYGFTKAFGKDSEEAFKEVSKAIVSSMNKNGNIDPVGMLIRFRNSSKLKKYELLLIRLFNSLEAAKTINKLFRLQNPSALRERGDIEFFSKGRLTNAEILINRRKNLEATKAILEVYRDYNGNVSHKRV